MSIDTRGMSSCCTLATNSQLYGRTCQPLRVSGSRVVFGVTKLPKSVLDHGPHCPCAAGFIRSQFGVRVSIVAPVMVLVMLVEMKLAGAWLVAVCAPSCATPRVALNFTAVLPVPKRSYDAPTRGLRSFQFTTLSSPGSTVTGRLGVNRVGDKV